MKMTHVFSIGLVAAGLTCVSGYASASDKANGESTSDVILAAEGGKGSGSSGTGMEGGNTDPDKKSGSSGKEMGSQTPEDGKSKQGSGTSSGSGTGMESGKSGSAGASGKGSGDSDSYGAYYGPPGKGLSGTGDR